MKYFISPVILAIFCYSSPKAQTNKPKTALNHIALYAYDLPKAAVFYRDIIELDSIAEPFHDGRHHWFKIGEHSQLHLIKADSLSAHNKSSHICFSVASVDVFIERIIKAGINYEDNKGKPQSITLRPDGVKQVYLKDPEGFWVEINDDNYTAK